MGTPPPTTGKREHACPTAASCIILHLHHSPIASFSICTILHLHHSPFAGWVGDKCFDVWAHWMLQSNPLPCPQRSNATPVPTPPGCPATGWLTRNPPGCRGMRSSRGFPDHRCHNSCHTTLETQPPAQPIPFEFARHDMHTPVTFTSPVNRSPVCTRNRCVWRREGVDGRSVGETYLQAGAHLVARCQMKNPTVLLVPGFTHPRLL